MSRAVSARPSQMLSIAPVSASGSILYCTNHPCVICAKMIINAGVTRIVVSDGYRDDLAAQMLREAGIEVTQI